MSRNLSLNLILILVLTSVLVACDGQSSSSSTQSSNTASQPTVPAPSVASEAATATPASTTATEVTKSAIQTQDGVSPRFSHPTVITNPLYPVSLTAHAIFLGKESSKPARNEVTLLPITKTISWNAQSIETQVTQFVAYVDDQIVEIAYDYWAQADDGGVFYLGEDVSNYEDGKIPDHE